MVMLWHEVDFDLIYKTAGKNGRFTLSYGPEKKPLRFQIPPAFCQYGIGSFNALNLDFSTHQTFINWFADLETAIGAPEPFSSNMKNEFLRLKVDESTLFFDWANNMKQPTEIKERMYSNCEIRCIVEISSIYFFNDVYGLTCRVYQMKTRERERAAAEVPKHFAFTFT